MMMCHLIKFGCKKISSSADMVETVISDHMSPCCDLDLENNSLNITQNTPAYDDVLSNLMAERSAVP